MPKPLGPKDLPAHLRPREARIKGVAAKDRRTADGIVFDSRKEMLRYQELQLMQRAGRIRYFLRQVPFHLPGGVKYVCDFMVVRSGIDFTLKGGLEVASRAITFEDVKGYRTEIYKLKKKQVEAIYGVEIVEI